MQYHIRRSIRSQHLLYSDQHPFHFATVSFPTHIALSIRNTVYSMIVLFNKVELKLVIGRKDDKFKIVYCSSAAQFGFKSNYFLLYIPIKISVFRLYTNQNADSTRRKTFVCFRQPQPHNCLAIMQPAGKQAE